MAEPATLWYERAERAAEAILGIVSPGRAATRRHLRRMDRDPEYRAAALLGLRMRGYRAAEDRPGQTPWRAGGFVGRSADAEILWDLPRLRNRSRELGRDEPLGSGLLSEFQRHVVGTGLRPQAQTLDRDKDSAIEGVFRRATANLSPADGLSYGALQRMRFLRLLEDGEVFVVASVSDEGRLLTETVEADRVSTPAGAKPQDPKGSIRAGVERDATGAPVAYYVSSRHPLDVVVELGPQLATTASYVQLSPSEFVRVPAARVRHLRLTTRPGQTRGVPFLHAVLQDLHDLDLLLQATLKRTQVAACLAVFLESTEQTSNIFEVTAQKYGYQLDQDLEPGMIFKLYPGEKVSQITPSANAADLEKFAILLARRIGAALGVSWQTVLKDWSASNYSSARTQILEDRITYGVLREDFVQDLLQWEWRWVLQWELLTGNPALAGVEAEDLETVGWIADAQDWVDPSNEATATEKKLGLGLTTKRDEIAAQGRDWEDVLRQRLVEELREKELREELGLPPAASAAPAAPAAPESKAVAA